MNLNNLGSPLPSKTIFLLAVTGSKKFTAILYIIRVMKFNPIIKFLFNLHIKYFVKAMIEGEIFGIA